MRILIVSSFEYSITNRGIDIMTQCLLNNNHIVDHMVFFTRIKKQNKNIALNLRQIYFYDRFRLYRKKFRYFWPGFLIRLYFDLLVKKQEDYDFTNYDLVILESGYPVYLASVITAPIIYRQADPVEGGAFASNRRYFKNLEYNIINKSLITSSALEKQFFPKNYLHKYSFWHSGYIPPEIMPTAIKKRLFVYIGLSPPDFSLIKSIAINYPDYQFQLIGPFKNRLHLPNVIYSGYLSRNEFEKILSEASLFIMPLTRTNRLIKYSYTSRMFVAMHIGLPILVKKYGLIQENDESKKLYVYSTKKQALLLLKNLVSEIESNKFNFTPSNATREFLKPRMFEQNMKKLDIFFNNLFSSIPVSR
jgi:hypothetical protein